MILEVETMNGTGHSLGRTLAAAFPHTVPVLTGYLVLGMAYGVLMQAKGYGAIWAFLMSAVAFAGACSSWLSRC